MDTAEAEGMEQSIQISGSVAEEEWFSGEGSYKVWIRTTGKKPDKICLSWNEEGGERTKELHEPVSEKEWYEYEAEFEAEELEYIFECSDRDRRRNYRYRTKTD